MSADVRDYIEWAHTPVDGSDAEARIQWKGTDVCLDFECPCGEGSHLDDCFAYSVQCPACGATYDLGVQVRVRRVDEPFSTPKVLCGDSEWTVSGDTTHPDT